jgi:purine-nucleoside phosphorylase
MSTHTSKDTYYDACAQTAKWLKEQGNTPDIALVLGSGLGGMADTFEQRIAIPYEDIPNFPVSTVEGHAGQLVFGTLHGRSVVAMQGRFHYYEGWSQEEVTFPIRVFALMGAKTLIVTNSSGGINPDFMPGDLMLINDHLNLTGQNPLRGHNDTRFGPRFPDMTDAYNVDLRNQAMEIAQKVNVSLHTGVYSGLSGPTYETPAEIRMLRRLGGDAVGMSTVPEVIVANHSGMRVLGISCITNMAAGISAHKLNHEEVTTNAQLARAHFTTLVDQLIADLVLDKPED